MAKGYKNIVGFSKARLCETIKIFFFHLMLFFKPLMYDTWERRWILARQGLDGNEETKRLAWSGQTHSFSIVHTSRTLKRVFLDVWYEQEKKKQIHESTTISLKTRPVKTKLLFFSFYSNLTTIIAPEKTILAQLWAYSCYRDCNYSLKTDLEFVCGFINIRIQKV